MKLAGFTITEILSSFEDTVFARAVSPDGNKVIIKYRNDPQPNDIHNARWQQEYSLLQSLNSPYIIKPKELIPDEYGYMMVMEDFAAATLSKIIRENELNFTKRLKIACLLITALTDIHKAKLTHRSLSPDNIFVNLESMSLRLADLSMASSLNWQSLPVSNREFKSTCAYMSPELISGARITIDHRSDFYSLGAVLYHLLAGARPFICDDLTTMVQAHLSKVPEPLDSLDSKIPHEVSAIVLKLLEKSVDSRYQNHFGLLDDMKHCHQQWQTKGQIDHFEIAQADIPDTFTLSSQIYGRSIEQTGLQAAFGRASRGLSELILIGGPAGVGKSTLVHQLHDAIIAKRGFFIQGSCNQYYRNRPYGALIEAFTHFIEVLLNEGEERLRYWRGKLKKALGRNTAVIAEILPSIGKVIGEIPDLPELPPNETEKRFHITFGHFIKALSSSGHPLVIFLDNMQWADVATLHLAAHQTIANENNAVLMIGAYRNDEVDPTHPLLQMVESIELAQGRLRSISINNLARHHIHQLIVDSFACHPNDARTIVDECYEKTHGNPFFVKQFLFALHEHQQLKFDVKTKQWLANYHAQSLSLVNLQKDEHQSPIEAIVELVTTRLHRLDWESQHLLAIAAHLGKSFSLVQLAIVAEKELDRTAALMFPALQADLLIALDENYKFNQNETRHGRSRYCFFHDLIQQAAYRLIPEKDRPALQLNIARLILKQTPTNELDTHLYTLLESYNKGRRLINDPQEKARLMAFNIHAGIKAKNASAFNAAVSLLRIAKSLTTQDAWHSAPNQTLSIYKELAEAEYLAGNFQRAENLYIQGIEQSQDILTTITLYLVQAEQYQIQNRHEDAIVILEKGLTVLKQDVIIDEKAAALVRHQHIEAVELILVNIEVSQLLNLSHMASLEHIFAMQMYYSLLRSLQAVHKTKSYAVCSCQLMQLTLKYGQCDITPVALVHYVATIARDKTKRQRCYQLGKLALEVADYRGNKYFRSTVYAMFAAGYLHWNEPMLNGLDYLRQVIQWGREGINLEQASQAALWLFVGQTIKGTKLPVLEQAINDGLDFIRQVDDRTTEIDIIISSRQSVLSLQNKTADPHSLDSEKVTISQLMRADKHKDSRTLALYSYAMLRHAYFTGNRVAQEQMIKHLPLVEKYFSDTPLLTDFIFFKALSILNNTVPGKPSYVDNIKRVKQIAATVKSWANQSPRNYEHKYLIICAELAKVSGDIPSATGLFDKAIEASEQAGFKHCEALANELFATCWAHENQSRVAKTFIREAYQLYYHWGATAKCELIEEQWPHVSFKHSDVNSNELSATKSRRAPTIALNKTQLDVRNILAVNQQLAKEIHFEPLIRQFMQIMLEHTAAQYGAVIFDEDSRLMVEAMGRFSPLDGKISCHLQTTSLAEVCAEIPPKLPSSLIRYVQQTQETLYLNKPLDDQRFSHNDYLKKRKPACVLLIPIIGQGRLLAIAYLENSTQHDAFTPSQVESLQILSNQAAISLGNAQLYDNLNKKNQKRKEQLKRAKDKADRANETKSLFLANMSHEIRTPLTTVIGFAEGILFGDIEQKNQQQAIQTIANSGKHLLLLINDILDFSKIEAGQLLVEKIDVNLVELLANIEPISVGMAKPKSIAFDIDITLPLPDIISTDPTRLNQILLNLISNAIKFTENGGVTLKVFTQDQHLYFQVIDTGVGIKEDKIGSLFFAFEQADKTVQRKYGGTGLGLTISKSLAQMLGGDIVANSIFGEGSTFTVAIDLAIVDNTEFITTHEQLQEFRSKLEGAKAQPVSQLQGHILVAEDQPENLQLIITMLEKMGLEVTGVTNGQEAVEAYLIDDFDLILLDIQMPIMDGLETFDMLTSLSNDTPVIALTANAMKHEVDEYFRKGFDEHLSKPIERKPFIEKISHFLGQSANNVDASLSDEEMAVLQNQFSANLPAYLDRLTEHLRTQDWCSLQQDAHALKGAAGTLGFTQLSDLAANIEQELKEDLHDPIEQDVADLVKHVNAQFPHD